jgi:hypothetical protein
MVWSVSRKCKAIVPDPLGATLFTERLAVVAGKLFDNRIQNVELYR